MRRQIHVHLDKMVDEARAAGKTYGKYVAEQSHPVTVILPDYLKFAPTMFERLAGEEPPPAPKYEYVRKINRRPPPVLPVCPEFDPYTIKSKGYVEAKWLRPKRKVAGLTGEYLAKLCNVSRKTIVGWEEEERVPVVVLDYINEVLDAYINYRSASHDDDE